MTALCSHCCYFFWGTLLANWVDPLLDKFGPFLFHLRYRFVAWKGNVFTRHFELFGSKHFPWLPVVKRGGINSTFLSILFDHLPPIHAWDTMLSCKLTPVYPFVMWPIELVYNSISIPCDISCGRRMYFFFGGCFATLSTFCLGVSCDSLRQILL